MSTARRGAGAPRVRRAVDVDDGCAIRLAHETGREGFVRKSHVAVAIFRVETSETRARESVCEVFRQ